jgi:glycosidase
MFRHIISLLFIALSASALFNCDRGSGSQDADIMYFILIDRFMDGDPSNNEGGVPASYLPYDGSHPEALKHYQGGDLKGILDQLDELAELGITMIWISPFLDNSNRDYVSWWPYHGYHPIDFYAIDEHFGDLDNLKTMVNKAHTLGLKVIFDMPFNQTSPDHPWLQDPEKADWFHFDEAGQPYEISDWFDQKQIEIGELHGLPDLAQENPEVRDYLIEVSKYWIRETGCDGFRLDAVKHIPLSFWEDYNDAIRAFAGPEFLLIGEVFWGEAERIQPYTTVGFDMLFDIPGYYAIRNTFSLGASFDEFTRFYWDAQSGLGETPLATLIDNHDVARFNVGLGESAWAKQRLALGWLMTRPGLPVIYYGTELGMQGYPVLSATGEPQDFLNRLPMPAVLDPADSLKREAFKALVGLRRDHPVLARGSFHEIYKDWSIFAFIRSDAREQIMVLINTASTEEFFRIPIPEGMESQRFETIYGEGGIRQIENEWWLRLPAISMTVWKLSGPIPDDLRSQVTFTNRYSADFQEITLFVLDPGENYATLDVAGDFNNWRPAEYTNRRQGDSLLVILPLKPGQYEYKLVLDGELWMPDPNAAGSVVDPFGGLNSLLTIPE